MTMSKIGQGYIRTKTREVSSTPDLGNCTVSDSCKIAELTNKEHRNVTADCDRLNESYRKMGIAEISAVNYKAENGQTYRKYLLTKMQTFDLLTGYSQELRIKVNRRWEQLEKNQMRSQHQERILSKILIFRRYAEMRNVGR